MEKVELLTFFNLWSTYSNLGIFFWGREHVKTEVNFTVFLQDRKLFVVQYNPVNLCFYAPWSEITYDASWDEVYEHFIFSPCFLPWDRMYYHLKMLYKCKTTTKISGHDVYWQFLVSYRYINTVAKWTTLKYILTKQITGVTLCVHMY